MITAVDSNVLLDVLAGDRSFGQVSRGALHKALAEGDLIACDVVWAEVAAAFDSIPETEAAMEQLRVRYIATDASAAIAAGVVWRSYRRAGGARTRLIADFLVGAHATRQADRLLTRDRGFYRSYFKELALFDPTERT